MQLICYYFTTFNSVVIWSWMYFFYNLKK